MCTLQGIREVYSASAIGGVQERYALSKEDVACVEGSQRREDDPGISAGVSPSEVVQIDLVGPTAQ